MLPYTLVLAYLCTIAAAAHNITLDDNDPSIVYIGEWLKTPHDPLNAGGRHQVSVNSDSAASLTFTGTAIYFYSPLWPFRVTTAVSLDQQASTLLDLRDYDSPFVQDGPETQKSQVVWYMDNLPYKEHVLSIFVGTGEDLAIVDSLVYTIPDPTDTVIVAPSSSTHSQTRTLPTSSATSTQASAASSTSHSSKTGLAITLGIVCSIFGVVVLWGGYWYWRRRRRRQAEGLYAAHGDSDPDMSESATRRPSYPRTTGIATAGRGGRGGSVRGKRPAPPPPRSSARSAAAARRAKKPLTTIPETSGDADTLSPTRSNEEDESGGSQESNTVTSPSPPLSKGDQEEWVGHEPPSHLPTIRLVPPDNS